MRNDPCRLFNGCCLASSSGLLLVLLSLRLLEQHPANAWTWKPHSNNHKNNPAPRVSGHSAATTATGDRTYVFGGLFGNAGSPCSNDLWWWTSSDSSEWNKKEGDDSGPGPRMYSAAAMLGDHMYLMGGWDPGAPGSGGTFLDDVWCFDGTTMKWTLMDEKLPCGPVSRHAACTVGDNKIVLHSFRGVCAFDGTTWTQQETTGDASSPDGLSMCAMIPLSDSSVLLFGGATKTQQLSSDAFVLDTNTWEWTKLDISTSGKGPSPRASPCAAKCNDDDKNQAIIFGGASLGDGGYEGGKGLQAQDDTWLLTVDGTNARWDRLDFGSSSGSPRARLAATLSPTVNGDLLLQGGWDPKGETFDDTWLLKKQ